MQNVHRYFLYLALLLLVFLAHDVWKAMWFADPATGSVGFGIGVGTLVLATQCGAAGRLHLRLPLPAPSDRRLPRRAVQDAAVPQAWRCVSCLNRRHMLWAWISLFGVMFADLYVRLCSMGIWTDWRLI